MNDAAQNYKSTLGVNLTKKICWNAIGSLVAKNCDKWCIIEWDVLYRMSVEEYYRPLCKSYGVMQFIRGHVLMFNVAVDFRLERRGRGVPTPAQLAGMVWPTGRPDTVFAPQV